MNDAEVMHGPRLDLARVRELRASGVNATPGQLRNRAARRDRLAVYLALKGRAPSRPFFRAAGYSRADLRAHLERLFRPGMSWSTYGQTWELDHVRPVASFAFRSRSDRGWRECWALANLRPVTRRENMRKGATWRGAAVRCHERRAMRRAG